MGDYAIQYKLRAYITNAKAMMQIKSHLHENIQEQFYSHGVEILSPGYMVRRDEKPPSDDEIYTKWEASSKKGDQVFVKDTQESIGGGFGLMDKTLVQKDKN